MSWCNKSFTWFLSNFELLSEHSEVVEMLSWSVSKRKHLMAFKAALYPATSTQQQLHTQFPHSLNLSKFIFYSFLRYRIHSRSGDFYSSLIRFQSRLFFARRFRQRKSPRRRAIQRPTGQELLPGRRMIWFWTILDQWTKKKTTACFCSDPCAMI